MKKYQRECALSFIKAKTSKGGDMYSEYEEFYDNYNEDCFDDWLKEQPKITDIIYRGYRTDYDRYNAMDIKIGKIVAPRDLHNWYHPSFTTSPLRAINYMNDYDVYTDEYVRLLFYVECKGLYCVDIHEYSVYPEENEHVFINDARLEITNIRERGHSIDIYLREV